MTPPPARAAARDTGTAPADLEVCVVLHQSAAEVEGLLASLVAQTRAAARYVFCQNGPDDGARALIEAAAVPHELVSRPDNPGFSAGVNACLGLARARWVALINPDVRLQPDFFARCLDALESDPQAAAVGGLLLRDGEDGASLVDSAGFVLQPWLRIVDRAAGAPLAAREFNRRESVIGVCAAAAVFDRAALLAVAEGGQVLDEDFFMYKEDQDLCLRLRAAGGRIIFEPSARAWHRRGWSPQADRRGVALTLRRHSLKNRYLLLLKHWRLGEHLWSLPFLVVFEIFLFVALALREPRTMSGYWAAARLAPKMFAKRRALARRTGR